MDPQGCELCNQFDIRPAVNSGTQAGKWKVYIHPGDLSKEYRLLFTSYQLQLAANSGCANCSLLLDGLRTISKKLDVFDDAQSYQGRIIVRDGCTLQMEVRGSKMNAPIRLEFFTPPNTEGYILSRELIPPLNVGTAEEIPSESPIERSVLMIRQWISNCENWHKSCVRDRNSSPPTRIIDVVGKALHKGSVCLVESRDMQLEPEGSLTYATLSHCWGKSQLLTTTRDNFAAHKKEISLESLPKTFRDAIMVVRALEIRYIWIDSLCIIQHDDEDWNNEAARMASVYSSSYLNLAATGSHDSRGGCFYHRRLYHESIPLPVRSYSIDRNIRQEKVGNIFVRPSLEKVHQRYHLPNEQLKIDDSISTPLLSRAWVFQERQLAPRTLHFHPTEMIMECKTALQCECTDLDKIHANSNKKLPDIFKMEDCEVLDQWFSIVEEYAALMLSHSTDRLVALLGIATIFQDRLKAAYLAGIWKSDIARGLLWAVGQRQANREKIYKVGVRKPRLDSHCAPSWSWASPILLTGDILTFPATNDSTFTPHNCFAFIDTNVPWLASGLLEDRSLMFLILQGLVVRAELSYHSVETEGETKISRLNFARDANIFYSGNYVSLDTIPSTIDSSVTGTIPLYCLLVGTVSEGSSKNGTIWLSTLLIEDSRIGTDLYHRVGVFDVREDAKIFRDAVKMTIKLI